MTTSAIKKDDFLMVPLTTSFKRVQPDDGDHQFVVSVSHAGTNFDFALSNPTSKTHVSIAFHIRQAEKTSDAANAVISNMTVQVPMKMFGKTKPTNFNVSVPVVKLSKDVDSDCAIRLPAKDKKSVKRGRALEFDEPRSKTAKA